MKKTLLILLFLPVGIFAQEAAPSERTFILGLNATDFVKSFLSFNETQPFGTNPYDFTMRRVNANNVASRIGVGVRFSMANQEDDQDDDEFKFTSYGINLGIGQEKRIPLSKRWLFYVGGDLVLRYSNAVNESIFEDGSQTNTENEMGFGLAPVVGIQFNLSERVSLSTEGFFECLFAQEVDKSEGTGSASDFNSEVKTTFISAFPVLPQFLYINISFGK